MPGLACHATAIALGGEALLICGPSRAGKSSLAFALIARSTRRLRVTLIGDDRVLLHAGTSGTIVRPHPRIAGFLERRGLGIVAMPWTAQAPVAGLVDVGSPTSTLPRFDGMPRIEVHSPCNPDATADIVLTWWVAQSAACATQSDPKGRATVLKCAKD